jgi:tetratricopeptide (TPR) repeat protein
MSFRLGDANAGVRAYSTALAVRQKIFDANQQNRSSKFELARTLGNFGDLHLYLGNADIAASHYQQALQHVQELALTDPHNAQYQRDLGLAHYRLGNLAVRRGDTSASDEHFSKALEIRQALAEKDTANDRRQIELMLSLAHCKYHEGAARLAAHYRHQADSDNELLLEIARTYAQCAAASEDAAQGQRYRQQAIEAITAAVDRGYKDAVYLESEVDFDPLQSDESFQALIARVRQALSATADAAAQ